MFAVSGTLLGVSIRVTWANGMVRSSPPAALKILEELATQSPIAVGGYRHWRGEEALLDEVACYMLVQREFENARLERGDVPSLPELPEEVDG